MHAYHPNDSWGLEGPLKHSSAVDLAITSGAQKRSVAKTVAKIPPVLSGMDKAEALAFVSRLFDSAQAGAVLWRDGSIDVYLGATQITLIDAIDIFERLILWLEMIQVRLTCVYRYRLQNDPLKDTWKGLGHPKHLRIVD